MSTNQPPFFMLAMVMTATALLFYPVVSALIPIILAFAVATILLACIVVGFFVLAAWVTK